MIKRYINFCILTSIYTVYEFNTITISQFNVMFYFLFNTIIVF